MKTEKYRDVMGELKRDPNYHIYMQEAEARIRVAVVAYNERKGKKELVSDLS